jgi:hypothetical protein
MKLSVKVETKADDTLGLNPDIIVTFDSDEGNSGKLSRSMRCKEVGDWFSTLIHHYDRHEGCIWYFLDTDDMGIFIEYSILPFPMFELRLKDRRRTLIFTNPSDVSYLRIIWNALIKKGFRPMDTAHDTK